MVGQPIELTGVQSNGEPFDWSRYEGKVVLVDFWATWCRPCIETIPSIKQNYQKYQKQGFEVVGINMDQDQDEVRQFIEDAGIPWVNVMADRWGENENAVRYAVEAIPFLVLVGRDGNVSAIHVRGTDIGRRLEEILGQST